MSKYKLSIIMPVYNSEKFLSESIESIINQSIGIENIELIIINDASTDGTKKIIERYCKQYSNFKAIHLNKNIGAAYGPRNIGLKKVSSKYVMFLDADDTFTPDACEILYNEISSTDSDIVFGRYYRVYDHLKIKSYSPYDKGDNDINTNPRFNSVVSFFWKNILYKILYGNSLEYKEKIIIKDIHENPEILKILPSIWTKIIKTEKCGEFPELITGEDLNFILDVLNNSKIIFLNNEYITNYHMRFDEHLSITKNITFQLVFDSIHAYRIAIEKCENFNFRQYTKMINPFLLNYIYLLKQVKLDSDEKKLILKEINQIDETYKKDFVGFLLIKLIKILSS